MQLMEGSSYMGGLVNVWYDMCGFFVGWEEDFIWQLLVFDVLLGKRNVMSYMYFVFWVGQFDEFLGLNFENLFNEEQLVFIGINDGQKILWCWLDFVLVNDCRFFGNMQGVFMIFEVWLMQFNSNVDKLNVECIFFVFFGGMQGILMIDSVEWFCD